MRIGVLGCMAERLKDQLLGVADVVAGPDAYRLLPFYVTFYSDIKIFEL